VSGEKVNLVSGYSNCGGSTIHHIALTNLLNENGIECTFYGPHEWHLDKCKGDLIKNAALGPEDILISHFVNISAGVSWKKHILSCHETNLFPLKKLNLSKYDVIHFVSNSQKKWHSVNHPSAIIPNIVQKVSWTNPNNKVAGVIGSIDIHKQPHLSIQRALKDGFVKVLLFGEITDFPYFNQHVSRYVEDGDAVLMGHEEDRETMYGLISVIYHTSIRETYGLVEAECKLAGIPFNGPANDPEILEKEEILERWKKLLNQ